MSLCEISLPIVGWGSPKEYQHNISYCHCLPEPESKLLLQDSTHFRHRPLRNQDRTQPPPRGQVLKILEGVMQTVKGIKQSTVLPSYKAYELQRLAWQDIPSVTIVALLA